MKVSKYTCDRCGAVAESSPCMSLPELGWLQLGGELHLCPPCNRGLQEMQARHDAENKAYMRPLSETGEAG